MNHASATTPEQVEPTLAPIFVPGPLPMPAGGHHATSGDDTESSDDEAKTVTVTVTTTKTKTKNWKSSLAPIAIDPFFTPNLEKKDVSEIPSRTTAHTTRQLVVPSIGMDGIVSILASIYATVTPTPDPLLEKAESKVPHSIVTIGSHTIDMASVWSMIQESVHPTATHAPLLERAESKVPQSIVTIGSHTINLAGVWSMIHASTHPTATPDPLLEPVPSKSILVIGSHTIDLASLSSLHNPARAMKTAGPAAPSSTRVLDGHSDGTSSDDDN